MILIIYANAGYGHKKAALAIQEEIKRKDPRQECEVMDILSLTSQSLEFLYPGSYKFLVTYMPWLWRLGYRILDRKRMYPIIFPFRNMMNRSVLYPFKHYLMKKNPKVIIFTHFLGIPRAINLRKQGKISGKINVCITDFETHSFWIYPEVDKYYVMCEETKKEITDKWEIPEDRVMTTGVPIAHKFQPPAEKERKPLSKKYRLDPNRMTLFFSSGSFGIGPTEDLLAYLAQFSDQIQVIIVCGKNRKMQDKLMEKDFLFPVIIYGFVDCMHELMKISDILIAKPGGITTCESLSQGIPMIISSLIPGQEEGNRNVLAKYDACWELKSSEDIKTLMKEILENPEMLRKKKENIQKLAKPHASQDITEHVLKILSDEPEEKRK